MKKIISLAIAAVMCAGLAFGAGCSHTHEYGDWQTLVPATCTREGRERRDCKVCEEYQTRDLPMISHTLSDVFSADGSKHWKECSVCHQHIDEGPHTYSGSYCTVCQYDKNGTGELEYRLNDDKHSFAVTGVLGSAPEQVTVPNLYVGLPVTRIAEGAFIQQRAMKSITLSNRLTTIESGAFDSCTALQTVEIPASVTVIGRTAFTDCTALGSVTVASGNNYFTAEGGILYDAPMTKFVFVPSALKGTLEIPETITEVDSDIFASCGLEKIVVGPQVTEIAPRAFVGCRALKEFEVQGSETVIGQAALIDCPSINRLVLANTWQTGLSEPDSGRIPGDRATGDSYIGYIFGAGLYLETGSRVPASLKTVEFTGGEKLRNYTFLNCSTLENVILPASLQALEDMVFSGCGFLHTVSVAAENTKYYSQDGVVYAKDGAGAVSRVKYVPLALAGPVRIPEGVTEIGEETFRRRAISELTLPASLEYLKSYAFADCTELTSVVLPEESNLISYGDYSFSKCEKLKGIVIPAKMTDIGVGAFSGCNALETITFKETAGWSQGPLNSPIPIEPLDLVDPYTAATMLKASAYTWKRSV